MHLARLAVGLCVVASLTGCVTAKAAELGVFSITLIDGAAGTEASAGVSDLAGSQRRMPLDARDMGRGSRLPRVVEVPGELQIQPELRVHPERLLES